MTRQETALYVICNWFLLKKTAKIADIKSDVVNPEKERKTLKLKKAIPWGSHYF